MRKSRSTFFNILDNLEYLDVQEEHRTYIKSKCPICNGNNLKIQVGGSKNGAYACYSSYCHEGINKIREYLLKINPKYSKKVRLDNRKPKLVEFVKPITLSPYITLEAFKTNASYVPPDIRADSDKLITEYDYGSFKLTRYDFFDVHKKKVLFPNHKVGNVYVKRFPVFDTLPVYKEKYLKDSGNIIIVEGEKCADIGQKIGYNAICIPYLFYGEDSLRNYAKYFKRTGIKQVIVIPDCDDPGYYKAKNLLYALWSEQIPAATIDLRSVKNIKKEGYDLYDLYNDYSLTDLNILNNTIHDYVN